MTRFRPVSRQLPPRRMTTAEMGDGRRRPGNGWEMGVKTVVGVYVRVSIALSRG